MPATQQHIADRMGRAMRQIRQRSPWDQKTLAGRMGITRLSLGRIERAQTQPRMNTLLTWCRVMKVSVADLQSVAQLVLMLDNKVADMLKDGPEGLPE